MLRTWDYLDKSITRAKLNIPGLWDTVYETTLTAATTSITISGLDGNAAEQYFIEIRGRNNYAGGSAISLRLNNDSGANYGRQYIKGSGTTVSATQVLNATLLGLLVFAIQYELGWGYGILRAKSGYQRQLNWFNSQYTSGTTVDNIVFSGLVWNNTADNITSMTFLSNQTDGIAAGTFIGVYKRV